MSCLTAMKIIHKSFPHSPTPISCPTPTPSSHFTTPLPLTSPPHSHFTTSLPLTSPPHSLPLTSPPHSLPLTSPPSLPLTSPPHSLHHPHFLSLHHPTPSHFTTHHPHFLSLHLQNAFSPKLTKFVNSLSNGRVDPTGRTRGFQRSR